MRKNRLNRRAGEDRREWNPMDGIANMADVMLVLAVGIMLALVINWNVDIGPSTQIDTTQALEISEDEMEQAGEEESPQEGDQLQEMGKVYYDAETGKYYIMSSE
ncbi:MAG: DUF2149 domain-containing protein [Bacillota bacterium]|nr:DUF2149 domain-containing protein [Bacillota bacterium]